MEIKAINLNDLQGRTFEMEKASSKMTTKLLYFSLFLTTKAPDHEAAQRTEPTNVPPKFNKLLQSLQIQ